MEKNYSKINMSMFDKDLAEKGRAVVGQELGLTGCEISFNHMPAGTFVPMVHSHKLNEEVYIIIGGSGDFKVDDDEFPIAERDVIRITPAGERAIRAGAEGLNYICIQSQNGSLTQSTMDDALISESKASWM